MLSLRGRSAPSAGREAALSAPDWGRRVRALVVAVVTVVLAVAAHVVGDGMAPSAPVLLPVIAAVWMTSYRLSERRIRRWQLVLLLGGAQLAVHTLSAVTAMSHEHADSGIDIDPVVMASGHAVATFATALILGFGERVWWQVLSWLRRHLPAMYRQQAPLGDGARATPAYSVGVKAWAGAGPVGMRAPPCYT